MKQDIFDFLTSLGLPAPVVLGVILAGVLVKYIYDMQVHGRELRQYRTEKSGTQSHLCRRSPRL